MEIREDCIVSSERYDSFGDFDERSYSISRVQEFLDRGLLTRDAVYRRCTDALVFASGESENCRLAFRQLQDPESSYLSKEEFNRRIRDKLFDLGVTGFPNAAGHLFEIFCWRAFFPFRGPTTDTESPCIDGDGFLRATYFLTRTPASIYHPVFGSPCYDIFGGELGPYEGDFISRRDTNVKDYLRYIFRSLARPTGSETSTETMIRTPRFVIVQPLQDSDSSDEDDNESSPEVVITGEEPERSIDIVDVLSEFDPRWPKILGKPCRGSYRLAVPSLPQYEHDLCVLRIPTAKLVDLLNLVEAVYTRQNAAATSPGLINRTIGRLDDRDEVDWETFKTIMLKDAELVADALSEIFDTFRNPQG
ncbi:hypothetical protein F4778DRAFT_378930 [Xylariomycetidae sp. FL2044]|nr:hypothetical protein F4778DRAFT_378930 [Xylariomycetidae sp. FL2044]